MLSPSLLVGYIGVSMIIGVLGRNRRMGGWGYFFGSLILTPIIGLLLLLGSDRKEPE